MKLCFQLKDQTNASTLEDFGNANVIIYSVISTPVGAEAQSVCVSTCITQILICNSYTMGCPPVRVDNPRALASGLSCVQVDKHGITILYHPHQCRPCTS